MKKLIILVALVGLILMPAAVSAQTVEELQAQTNTLIQQLITMLEQRILELQAQIANILASQQTMVQSINQTNQTLNTIQSTPMGGVVVLPPQVSVQPETPVTSTPVIQPSCTLTITSSTQKQGYDPVVSIAWVSQGLGDTKGNLFATQDWLVTPDTKFVNDGEIPNQGSRGNFMARHFRAVFGNVSCEVGL